MAIVEAHDLDHLTLLPRLTSSGPPIGAWHAAFTDGYAARGRGARHVALAPGARAMGYGAYNLIRRAALDASEGIEWFRLDHNASRSPERSRGPDTPAVAGRAGVHVNVRHTHR